MAEEVPKIIINISNHPNIVKFVDFIESMDCYYMVSEYCEGPNLE
jgi:serine/threonine protein kinase